MKNYIFILFSLLLMQGYAQDGSRIEQAKIGYITNKLNLSSTEAEKFWPLYNEYKSKIKAIRKEMRMDMKEIQNLDAISDKEAETTLNDIISSEQRTLDLKKEYFVKFKQILPIKKVILLVRAEREFNKEVLMQMRRK